eukprot:TRINITY_DN34416_c0_g1_i1.p3 TRINITY_DN34416_c0_g1~~TRINITY_DN34416_c0_g1_i1.p3  ORF type:complete len:103 (-),score=1.61 TRINITY_DN34416_c0_g1_i1:113-421(-)
MELFLSSMILTRLILAAGPYAASGFIRCGTIAFQLRGWPHASPCLSQAVRRLGNSAASRQQNRSVIHRTPVPLKREGRWVLEQTHMNPGLRGLLIVVCAFAD